MLLGVAYKEQGQRNNDSFRILTDIRETLVSPGNKDSAHNSDKTIDAIHKLQSAATSPYVIRSGDELKAAINSHTDARSTYQKLQQALIKERQATVAELQKNFAFSIGLLFLTALLCSILLARSLMKPLTSLSQQVRTYVESGFTLTEPMMVQPGADEVGQLSHDIQSLQDKLSYYVTSLIRQQRVTDEANGALTASRKHLTTAQRVARLGYFRWDTHTGLIDFSDELANLLQPPADLQRDSINDFAALIHLEERSRLLDDLQRSANNATNFEAEYKLVERPRAPGWLRIHLQATDTNNDGFVLATVQDISNQKAQEAQLERLAYFDSLTTLASRSYLYNRLEEMIRSATRRGSPFALMVINMDGFKAINDALGHEAGDSLLVEVGERLRETLRTSDFIAHLGGDEFCVLLEHTANDAEIRHVANRCAERIRQSTSLFGKPIMPSASIGIARFPGDGKTVHALMQAGDAALSAARNSRENFQFYDSSINIAAADRLAMSQALRDAFTQGQFELHFQPQVSLHNGQVKAWEALTRWCHPHKGLIHPADFIPEMEKLGLIDQLGEWVINAACEQIATWQSQGVDDAIVSINLAPTHLQEARLVTQIQTAIDHNDIRADQLIIEITESGFQTTPAGLAVMQQLKSIGVGLAIDDFGTGYSSLGSLKHLPIDCLKIDRSFVRDMLSSPKDGLLLRSIINLAQALEVEIVAEGVEEFEQIEVLKSLGCELIQGYFFSRPVPAHSVPAMCQRNFWNDEVIEQAS